MVGITIGLLVVVAFREVIDPVKLERSMAVILLTVFLLLAFMRMRGMFKGKEPKEIPVAYTSSKNDRKSDTPQKSIILQQNGEFFVILHAAPHRVEKFQWFVTDGPEDLPGTDIEGEIHESLTLSSQQIAESYEGKWIGCRYNLGDGERYKLILHAASDFGKVISTNQFDDIGFFDADGNISEEVQYVSANISADP